MIFKKNKILAKKKGFKYEILPFLRMKLKKFMLEDMKEYEYLFTVN